MPNLPPSEINLRGMDQGRPHDHFNNGQKRVSQSSASYNNLPTHPNINQDAIQGGAGRNQMQTRNYNNQMDRGSMAAASANRLPMS